MVFLMFGCLGGQNPMATIRRDYIGNLGELAWNKKMLICKYALDKQGFEFISRNEKIADICSMSIIYPFCLKYK